MHHDLKRSLPPITARARSRFQFDDQEAMGFTLLRRISWDGVSRIKPNRISEEAHGEKLRVVPNQRQYQAVARITRDLTHAAFTASVLRWPWWIHNRAIEIRTSQDSHD